MDPLTHAVLGATVAQAGFRRRLGRPALAAGAVVGMLPDADVVVGWLYGPFAALVHHRGFTHSIVFAAIFGPLLGLALWRLLRRWAPTAPPGAWSGLCVAVLATHPLIDLVTHYGTQLLAPLSTHRFGIPAMPIIDPVFTLILIVAVVVAVATRRAAAATATAWAALLLCWGYVLFAWSLNDRAEAEARRQLAAAGIVGADVRAYPTILQPYLRRIVARDGQAVLIGSHSALAPAPIAWRHDLVEGGPEIAAVAATPEAAILEWFADGQVLWRVVREGGVPVVEGRDLRYGFPDDGDPGMWGLRVPLDREGLPAAAPRHFHDGPEASADNIGRLWRMVRGR